MVEIARAGFSLSIFSYSPQCQLKLAVLWSWATLSAPAYLSHIYTVYRCSSLHTWISFTGAGSIGVCTYSHRHSSYLCPEVYQFTHKNTRKYRHSWFYCASHILHFLQIEYLCQICKEQIHWCHFSYSIFWLCVSLSHFGNSHNISNFFIIVIFFMVISGLHCY